MDMLGLVALTMFDDDGWLFVVRGARGYLRKAALYLRDTSPGILPARRMLQRYASDCP